MTQNSTETQRTSQRKILCASVVLLWFCGVMVVAAEAQAGCPGLLSRQEIEGGDGGVVELARGLKTTGIGVSFWQPGPTPAQIDDSECAEAACDALPNPPGWDEVDETIEHLQQFAGDPHIPDPDDKGLDEGVIDHLKDQTNIHTTVTWESWSKLFYDPDPAETDDFYDVFDKIVNGGVIAGEQVKGLKAWQDEFQAIKAALPPCQYNEDGNGHIIGVQNPPCRDPNPPLVDANGNPVMDFATSDGDFNDEFLIADTGMTKLIQDIESLRQASKDFVDTMTQLQAAMQTTGGCAGLDCGGKNPAGYLWTDSRGTLSVEAEVGPFKVARTKTKKSSKKICIVLKDYSDDGSRSWVKITRQEPSKELGFWNWNAYGGKTTKLSRSAYSFNFVKIAGTK